MMRNTRTTLGLLASFAPGMKKSKTPITMKANTLDCDLTRWACGAVVMAIFTVTPSFAAVIDFNLWLNDAGAAGGMVARNGPLDAKSGSSGDLTKDGVTMSLFNPIGTDTFAGTFDATNDGLAVNDDKLRAGESFQFSFDQDVILVSALTKTNRADVLLELAGDGTDLLVIAQEGVVTSFPANTLLPANTPVTVRISPDDLSPDMSRMSQISVTVVPEPASLGLLALGGLGLLRRRRAV